MTSGVGAHAYCSYRPLGYERALVGQKAEMPALCSTIPGRRLVVVGVGEQLLEKGECARESRRGSTLFIILWSLTFPPPPAKKSMALHSKEEEEEEDVR